MRWFRAVLVAAALLVAIGAAVLWLLGATYLPYLAVDGRCHTFDVSCHEHNMSFRWWRFTTPWTSPDGSVPTIRTRPYGYFLGDVREWGFRSLGFAAVRTEADDEYRPVVVFTLWEVAVPFWFLILVGEAPTAVWLLRRRRTRAPHV
jgi:hypothetical protein